MSLLFEPLQFGHLDLANKIVIAPMCQYSANEQGEVSYWHEQQWAKYALSGAGLCIVEATAVQPEGRISFADLGLWNDRQAEKIKILLEKIKAISPMPMAVQLAHAGRKASVDRPWHGGGQLSPQDPHGWQTVSASASAFRPTEHLAQALSITEIRKVIQDFADAAVRAVAAGFALIEVHAAHGYLLHQFLSPLSNQRTDQYGGCLHNRMRLTLEVIQAIKNVVPVDYPVAIRISATDWMPAQESWDVASSIVLAQQLEQLNIAYIHVSSAGLAVEQKINIHSGYQVPFASTIKQHVKTPVIAVGLITDAKQAEEILVHQQADAIAIGRALLYEPNWPWHAAAVLGDQIAIAPQYLRSQPHMLKNLFTSF